MTTLQDCLAKMDRLDAEDAQLTRIMAEALGQNHPMILARLVAEQRRECERLARHHREALRCQQELEQEYEDSGDDCIIVESSPSVVVHAPRYRTEGRCIIIDDSEEEAEEMQVESSSLDNTDIGDEDEADRMKAAVEFNYMGHAQYQCISSPITANEFDEWLSMM